MSASSSSVRRSANTVGASQLAEWEKYVFVPVKPNDADADTLKQLPKVDDGVASQARRCPAVRQQRRVRR